MRRFFLFSIALFFYIEVKSQDSAAVEIDLFTVNLGYGSEIPGGNMATRFGRSLSFTTGLEWMKKSKYSFGVDFTLVFGNKIKEDVLKPYRTELGALIGVNGGPADVFLRERAAYLGAVFGRYFSFSKKSSYGLKFNFGAGYFFHKIRIVDDSKVLAIADEPFIKGLDRLTKGPALKQELLFQIHSVKKNIHLNLGFNITEAFTKQIREVNFDTGMKADTERKMDFLYGIKATWMLPLSKSTSKDGINYY